VILVRDLHRHPEHFAAVESLLAQRPDAVLVEMGMPVCRPRDARAYLATYGASRASAIAAAEVMRPSWATGRARGAYHERRSPPPPRRARRDVRSAARRGHARRRRGGGRR